MSYITKATGLNKLVMLFSLTCSSILYAKDSITWGVGHLPPRVTIDGPNQLGGQGGIQQHLLQNKLKNFYHHQHIDMNWVHFEKEQKAGNKVCSSFIVKNAERVKHSVFSLPWGIELPLKVIMRSSTFNRMKQPKSISMREFLLDDNVSGVLVEGRTYPSLEQLIDSYPKTNITRLPINANKLLAMLNAGRFDYFIEYPHVALYMQQVSGQNINAITPVPIDEGFGYVYSRIACPKNARGQQVIARVNAVIRQERSKLSFLESLQMVHPREEEKQKVADIYYRDFLVSEN